jgi:lysophospholipid hydrolase
MSTVHSDLAAFLSATELFGGVGGQALHSIADTLETRTLAVGETLIRQGARDDSLYVVLSGVLAVTTAGAHGAARFLTSLLPGNATGEWSLLTGEGSAIEVTAVQEASVARLSRTAFEAVSARFPEDAKSLLESLMSNQRRSRLQLALYSSQLFCDLDELALRDLERELELQTFMGGDVLMRESDPGDCLYMVVSGRLRVVRQQFAAEERLISELGAGEIAGEMSLIAGQHRVATVSAIRDTEVARLSLEGLDRFIQKHPHAAVRTFSRKIVQRLTQQLYGSAPRSRAIRTVAVFPASRGVPLDEFSRRLAAALSAFGPTRHLSSSRVDSALEERGVAQAPETRNVRLMEWLNKLEAEYDYVVYECDPSPTAWTARATRHADRILLVGDAAQDPAPGEAEQWLLSEGQSGIGAIRSLVLLHGEGARPSGTAKWLSRRKVERHHHARLSAPADFDRVARFLLERALGLTLGGGFARGMVHCGVIRALNEMGLAIDAIGGNSMGAVLAAEWAQGWSLPDIQGRTARRCVECLKDMTLPLVAFKSGGKFAKVIQDFNGDTQIEDLWHPYFCVSSNLNRAELKVHTEGGLTKAILASTRVPGVFPPIVYDGELHVDGGLLNNVPVDVMRKLIRDGPVMGVDAVPARQFGNIPDYGFDLTGWRAFWNRFTPFGRGVQIPSILLIMLRTMEFGGVSRKRSLAEAADLYLRPPLEGFKPTDFSRAAEIVEVGYRSAMEGIAGWLENPQIPAGRKPFLRH